MSIQITKQDFQDKSYDDMLTVSTAVRYIQPDATFEMGDSGLYFLVNPTNYQSIRITVMRASDDCPMYSFESEEPDNPFTSANQLYKFIVKTFPELSQDHLAYIAYEIGRAETYIILGQHKAYVQS